MLSTYFRNQVGDQDVQLMNDRKVVATYNDPNKKKSGKPVDQGVYIKHNTSRIDVYIYIYMYDCVFVIKYVLVRHVIFLFSL